MSLKNIKLSVFREFLAAKRLKHIRTKGGHEIWSRHDLTRPVVIQTHENPVPEHIIKNNLRTIKSNRDELLNWLNPTKDNATSVSFVSAFTSSGNSHLN